MDFLWQAFSHALKLIFNLDRNVMEAVSVSLQVSSLAVLLASLVGIPLGFLVATRRFFGQKLVVTLLNTLMGLPTVAVGLGVYALVSRQGPLGSLDLLFSVPAMTLGQSILVTPIVAALTCSAVASADPRLLVTAQALGASRLQAAWVLIREMRLAVSAAVIAAFGRAVSEVGAAMILGGNIQGFTRTMTTAIALETSKGEFAVALALGLILLTMAFGVNIIFFALRKRA